MATKKSKNNYKDNDYLFQEKQKVEEALSLLDEVENTKYTFQGDMNFKNNKKEEVRQILNFFEMFDKTEHVALAKALKTILVEKKNMINEKINDVFSLKDAGLSTIDLFDESPLSF